MEVFLYNSTVCRLCSEENDNGTLLYTPEENIQNLNEVINTYLPIKVTDDGQLPRTICPGCTIQLEATVEFLNLIINGQKTLRELYQREKEYKKSVYNQSANDEDTDNVVIDEVDASREVYKVDHPVALQMAGLEKPKRKRGRPPKKHKTPEELAQEAAIREQQLIEKDKAEKQELSGKRMRKTPKRFKEVVQGKELEKIFIDEGVTDGEKSESEENSVSNDASKPPVVKEAEVIGHKEDSGELVVVVKGKGRGRPRGRMRPTLEKCAICGMEFSSVGRYMSHVARHGPVTYQCADCSETFATRLLFNTHQRDRLHSGQNIIAGEKPNELLKEQNEVETITPKTEMDVEEKTTNGASPADSLPDLDPPAEAVDPEDIKISIVEEKVHSPTDLVSTAITDYVQNTAPSENIVEPSPVEESNDLTIETTANGKAKLKCNFCDKVFSSKQSKSLHTKAKHYGEMPYSCRECGARFAYPRSLTLHALSHRRARPPAAAGYACDLCGKVLNHPSSVMYHKEAEHAGQRYVCLKCGKSFKHKQLLQRHQLVHSHLRPYDCNVCKASFKTKANLLNHQLLHSGVKKFTCEICNQKFAHKTSLTLHIRWHTGQKPYACKICGKSFSQKGNLSEHERIHTGEKPYACSLCPRRFTTSSQHRLHARRHLADRPYACDTCPKRFVSLGARAAHERREAGWRAHRCGECGRAFPERWALLKHMRRHTGERPFRCPHCPRAFADCSNLNKHKKQVHKQVSLLASGAPAAPQLPQPQQQHAELPPGAVPPDEDSAEGIIYVTYDADAPPGSAYQILDEEQAPPLDHGKVFTACSLYSGESLLVPQRDLTPLQEPQQPLNSSASRSRNGCSSVAGSKEHIAVTDEQGNPLHFTMQDGTRLAITSSDGKSLQVITEDGQTIPVEINGYAEEEEVDSPDTIVHHLNLQKTVDTAASSQIPHFYTIV